MANGPNFHVDDLLKEKRLDEIERLWIQNPSVAEIIVYLQGRLPQPGCETCGAEPRKTVPGCAHGAYRWRGQSKDRPMSRRNILYYLQAARVRMRHRIVAAPEALEENRAEAVALYRDLRRRALKDGNLALALAAARSCEAIDGTRIAAERVGQPTLYERVRTLMARVVDYQPSASPPRPAAAPAAPGVARFQLERLEQLLLMADDNAARFRRHGEPTTMDEAKRREWRRNMVDEALLQAATAPGLSPERRRDLVARLAGTAAFTTEDAEIAERLTALLQKLQGTTGAT